MIISNIGIVVVLACPAEAWRRRVLVLDPSSSNRNEIGTGILACQTVVACPTEDGEGPTLDCSPAVTAIGDRGCFIRVDPRFNNLRVPFLPVPNSRKRTTTEDTEETFLCAFLFFSASLR